MSDPSALENTLRSHGQTDVLTMRERLDADRRSQLDRQLEAIDWDELSILIQGEDEKLDFADMASRACSPPHVTASGDGASWSMSDAKAAGEQALRDGKVAALLVAGGQGTRLGFDHPKGMFPIGPVSQRTLFEIFADKLKATSKKYGVEIPWYIMTSEPTDAETRRYFAKHNHFGIDESLVTIFEQGTMPAVDASSGQVLMRSDDSLALSPDGHGGTVAALHRGGILDDCDRRGITLLSYFQVDNPLADLCAPKLLGHHLLSGSEMTTQVIRKRYPMEKVGNVVSVDDKVCIIEYSDLPQSAAEQTDDEGELRLWAGNIAVHVFDVAFLRRMAEEKGSLPFHRANKKVAHVMPSGGSVHPDEPNAVKFEKFIFDLLPKAKNAFVVECLPEEAFAPVKNADGADNDTPHLAKEAISNLHARWLRDSDVEVADGVSVEIHPEVTIDGETWDADVHHSGGVDEDRFIVAR